MSEITESTDSWAIFARVALAQAQARMEFYRAIKERLLLGTTIHWVKADVNRAGTIDRINMLEEDVRVKDTETGLFYWISIWSISELKDAMEIAAAEGNTK